MLQQKFDQPNELVWETFLMPDQVIMAGKILTQNHAVTLGTLIRGAWAILLSRYSREAEVAFAVILSQYLPQEVDGSPLVNARSLKVCVGSTMPLLAWLQELQAEWVALQRKNDSTAQAESSDNLICESVVLIVDDLAVGDRLPDSLIKALSQFHHFSSALLCTSGVDGAELELKLGYDPQRFEAAAISRMLGHLATLLGGMVGNPAQPLSTLPMLTPAERQQLLVDWNDTQADFLASCIHQLFEAQVTKTPDAIAVVFADESLTYRELNDRANQLAHHLQTLGVKPETLVGLCVERSLEMIVGIFGILKAGSAYVPLDPGYPQARLDFMLEDSQLAIVVTQQKLADIVSNISIPKLYLDSDWDAIAQSSKNNFTSGVTPENLVYVIYTSGSTGKPKGVLIPHRAICNHMLWMQAAFPLTSTDKVLQKTPFSFDASVWEFYAPLLVGAQLVMARPGGHQDGAYLIQTITEEKVTTLQLVPSLLQLLLEQRGLQNCQSLKRIFCGGEALPVALQERLFATLNVELYNLYGPTEACIDSTYWQCQPKGILQFVPIGRPIANLKAYILDQYLQPVPIGIAGELYIGGEGLARGYLNRPELTAERFILNPFSTLHSRLYKTGDLVRYLPDGNIEFLGRIDHQVKIRGFRIELEEIEANLTAHPAIRQAVVIAREDQPGNKRLVAYLVSQDQQPLITTELRRYLIDRVPHYAVPSAFVTLETMPQMPNGKVDRRALPVPTSEQPSVEQSYVAPKSELERSLAGIWSTLLGVEPVGVDDNFFELGGNSLLSLQVVAKIQQSLAIVLPVVKVFEHPTIAALAHYLSQKEAAPAAASNKQQDRRQGRNRSHAADPALDGVAIIGMVGRFPGAETIEDLWSNLCDGVDSITFFADDQLDPAIADQLKNPDYVKARGIVANADQFDAAFFGINPREAEIMDPQQRVFLELAWAALETAGYHSDAFPGSIGVYAGVSNNTYYPKNLATRPELLAQMGEFQTATLNEKDYVATRTSYKLNLKGPSLSIHTACSTSLVAINQAFHDLMTGQCDMALAGGASITVPQNSGYLYQEGGIFSQDGHCRTFDAQAAGTIFSDGAGVVVLKRLSEALQDGDYIYAVIRGAAVNNDGAAKVSFAAPSVEGQAGAIAMAQAYADIDPATITYIEAHGTATPLGDPIEVEALSQVFRAKTDAKQYCAIGSIKSNFGHTVAAAGVAGVIKTALSLKHHLIPPSLHFESPNPSIDFANSPFYVNAQLTEWQAGTTPRRAGVSSFGVGGTNAHAVLEEVASLEPSSPSRPRQVLLLSAKTQSALESATTNLASYLTQHPEVNLADVAYTLQVGRKGFNYRRVVICRDSQDAVKALTSLPPQQCATRQTTCRNPAVVFMFPGQGSQYVTMGLNLYEQEPIFRGAIDECAIELQSVLGQDLRDGLYPQAGNEEAAAELLRQTRLTQPALFVIEYALAQLWRSWGVQPSAMIGHSIGEWVAACLAGVFSLKDALMLVATRGQMMQDLSPGSMLSVRSPAAAIIPKLSGTLAVAAINAPDLCVVSGPTEEVNIFQQQLEQEGLVCRSLYTSHAFHSAMMNPIIQPFAECVRQVTLHSPTIPFISTVTATWITPEQATDPLYWAQHLRATVQFADGIQELWQQPDRVLLEVGPRTTAATLARKQIKNLKQQVAISSLSDKATDDAEWTALLQAVGQLWLAGVAIAWQDFYTHERRHRLPLPTYPFERKRFWVDPKPIARTAIALNEIQATSPMPQPIVPALNLTQSIPQVPEIAALTLSSSIDPQLGASMPSSPVIASPSRQQALIPQLKEILEDTSGLEMDDIDESMTFLEMGMDSLSLTQVALALQPKFNVKVTFRQLLEDFPTFATLAELIDSQLPPEEPPAAPVAVAAIAPVSAPAVAPVSAPIMPPVAPAAVAPPAISPSLPAMLPIMPAIAYPVAPTNTLPSSAVESVIAQQLQLMAQQLSLLQGSPAGLAGAGLAGAAPIQAAPTQVVPQPVALPIALQSSEAANGNGNGASQTVSQPVASQAMSQPPIAPTKNSESVTNEPKKAFGAAARIDTSEAEALTPEQQRNLEAFMQRYLAQTQKSKEYTQNNRSRLADPRAVSGFNRRLKELVYPIVTNRSAGSRLWDIDGNEYVDLTNGFGSNFFGYSAPFVTEAIAAQMQQGFEIGPQTPLAGEVAELMCEFTKLDRVAFCNTGSEVVLGAMRLARTVTGRSSIAFFTGDYHGIFDEVIVRGTKKLKTIPASPGILPAAVGNVLILDYDSPESLEILRSRAHELAAIMIEPVQSRRPELQPREFIHELRRITQESGAAFIVDEVITGFRVHPGGAQAHFGVQADLATYGKVVGGGMLIGVLAGKSKFMDALDGGYWQFGDDSFPEVGVTYFAGTFVRHPLVLAAAKASLEYLKQGGEQLQRSLNDRTTQLVADLNACFERLQAPLKATHFSSWFKIVFTQDCPLGELLYCSLRAKGLHTWDGRLCFLTLSHSEADFDFILTAFKATVRTILNR